MKGGNVLGREEELERGATLVEYALIVALVVVASLGAIEVLSDRTGDEVESRGDRIGQPALEGSELPPPSGGDGGDDDGGDGGDDGEITLVNATVEGEGSANTISDNPPRWQATVVWEVLDENDAQVLT
jgi:Flp pilus assembly pilin Flp